jgi:hypothetical protein
VVKDKRVIELDAVRVKQGLSLLAQKTDAEE